MSDFIFHITPQDHWRQAQASGLYYSPTFQDEGFIHCSTAEQLPGVLQRYYSGQTNLVQLVIDVEKLVYAPVYELAPSVNEMFPHIYGPINIEAVSQIIPL